MDRLGTETAFEVLARAKKLERDGKDIVHLQIGEPDFDTPRNIIEAGLKALSEGYTHYSPSQGIIELREAIAEDYEKRHSVHIDPDEVVIVPGGKPTIFYTILALVDEGDEVLCPNPGYPIYESVTNFIGGKVVPLRVTDKNDFKIDLDELESKITPKTKLLIINTPGNPTGGVLEHDDLKKITDIVKKHSIYLLSDEIYSRIIYDDFKHTSVLSFPDMKERTVMLDGFSKTYAMTGWRAGYAITNKAMAAKMTKLVINNASCTATFTQRACIEAVRGDQTPIDQMIAEFHKRRDIIVDGLNSIKGISCHKPKGAFYVFPNIEKTGYKSKELADTLLEKMGVAVLSGTAFGSYGEGFIRLSYANSIKNINKAIERIKQLLETK